MSEAISTRIVPLRKPSIALLAIFFVERRVQVGGGDLVVRQFERDPLGDIVAVDEDDGAFRRRARARVYAAHPACRAPRTIR